MDLETLIELRRQNISAYHAAMAARPKGPGSPPRAAFTAERGYRPLAFTVRDGENVRQMVFSVDRYRAAIFNEAMTRCIDSIDLLDPGAAEKLARYEFQEI